MLQLLPAQDLTRTQRHLLTVALLHHTGLVSFPFPLLPDSFPDTLALQLFPALLRGATRICLNSTYWNSYKTELPTISISHENTISLDSNKSSGGINWVYFIKEVVDLGTEPLEFRASGILHAPTLTSRNRVDLLADEIALEWELKAQILKHRENLKKYIYNANIGKKTLGMLLTEYAEVGETLHPATLEDYTTALTVRPEKLKLSVRVLETLRDDIVEKIGGARDNNGIQKYISIDPSDTLSRSQVALTVGYLDKIISDWNSVTNLFGAITVKRQATLPSSFPTGYTVTSVESNPFPLITGLEPKNKHLASTTNPIIMALLEKRKQQELAAALASTTESSTTESTV